MTPSYTALVLANGTTQQKRPGVAKLLCIVHREPTTVVHLLTHVGRHALNRDGSGVPEL